jgi:ribonuclease HII
MPLLHEIHPVYHWDRNKGYGTEDHLHALAVHGPTAHHRRSFAPIHHMLYATNPGTLT